MVNLTIDNIHVQVEEGTTVLDAAISNGINIPHLCYLKEINDIGACRVCCVEVQGVENLVPSCNQIVHEGMVVLTNSHRVRLARRINVELILSQHDCHCAYCVRSGNCSLQTLANDLDILTLHYKKEVKPLNWNMDYPLIRDDAKCINCMRCIQICDKVQNIGVWGLESTGVRTSIAVTGHRKIENSDCTLCGQCITHCPTGALRERDDLQSVFQALADPEKVTIVQIAPAVRAAWGESLGIAREDATVNRLVAALHKIGFDYIVDTNFSADLTIMEEGSEFLQRLSHRDEHPWPLFTSCCPGWVRFLKSQYPDMVFNLSTAKSPQQMFGAVAKTYYAELLGIPSDKIFSVSIMPCLAKKDECTLPTMIGDNGKPDVDVVVTTRELDRLIRTEHIEVQDLEDEGFDPILEGSGAAVIFGATGGVMIAALRSAYFLVTGKNPEPDTFKSIRDVEGYHEDAFEFDLGGTPVRVAVVSGLGNARKIVEDIRSGKVHYDFVEIMACPGGCAGGGGQPIHDGIEMAGIRGETLWSLDQVSDVRFSHENPSITSLYSDYLDAPLSKKAHHLLHTDHTSWDMPH